MSARSGSIAKPLADGVPSGPGSELSHYHEGVAHRIKPHITRSDLIDAKAESGLTVDAT